MAGERSTLRREQIGRVRRFNDFVLQRGATLRDSYLRCGRPLGEARLLLEVGPQGAEVRALRAKLGFNSGYLSNLLRSLEAQGLVRVGKHKSNGRVRCATLTPEGRREYEAYNKFSDELAESILEPLNEAGREALVDAMTEIQRLSKASSIHAADHGSLLVVDSDQSR
jgi:DNA-binding MarR family transcriptional regulator